MRIILDGPFDMGVAAGVDDHAVRAAAGPLAKVAREVFGAEIEVIETIPVSGEADADDGRTRPYAVGAPFGEGLRLRISSGPFLENWRRDAELQLQEQGAAATPELLALARGAAVEDVTLFLFPVGVGVVRLRTAEFEATPQVAHALFRALEYGGYGDTPPPDGRPTANAMLAAFRTRAHRILTGRAGAIMLADGAPPAREVDIRGFQGVVALAENDPAAVNDPGFFRDGDAVHPIKYGQLDVTFSWLISTIRRNGAFEVNLNRFLFVSLLARASWELTHTAQARFDEMLRLRLSRSLRGDRRQHLTRRRLNLLKNLCGHLLNVTAPGRATVFAGDLRFLELYEGYARTEERRADIRVLADAFASAEEDEITILEEERAARLNALIGFLTVVSLVSVSASVFSAWRDGMALIGAPVPVIAILILPALAALVALAAMSGRRRR